MEKYQTESAKLVMQGIRKALKKWKHGLDIEKLWASYPSMRKIEHEVRVANNWSKADLVTSFGLSTKLLTAEEVVAAGYGTSLIWLISDVCYLRSCLVDAMAPKQGYPPTPADLLLPSFEEAAWFVYEGTLMWTGRDMQPVGPKDTHECRIIGGGVRYPGSSDCPWIYIRFPHTGDPPIFSSRCGGADLDRLYAQYEEKS